MNAAPAAGESLAGTVLESFDAAQYTYLRLQTPAGEQWAAVPQAKVAVGASARVLGVMWMSDFKSATLNRSWPRIAFGVLDGASGAAPSMAAPQAAQPTGRSAGMFAQAAAGAAGAQGAASQAGPGSPHAPPPDGTPIAVSRATGAGAHTIAEVYAQKSALKDAVIRVRGKVVKETDSVMGKNWLHLRDGSGQDASADLTFATTDASSVGEIVELSGTVHLDRDLGAGYHYDVLIEDARIEQR
jgi:hypothetical protein